MPLEQRVVEPITVSRGTLPLDAHGNLAINIPNELECVTNGSLANVIRQLSSLSHYAEDLFGGILAEATHIINRASALQGRVDRLAVKVTQLDSSVEEVSLHDIGQRKPFKSSTSYEQQVVSNETRPPALRDQYEMCDKPPPLSMLNPYRDDGRDALKFYTDSGYFFELWRQEMLRETERERSGRKQGHRGPARGQNGSAINDKNRKKTPRQPSNSREKYQKAAAQQDPGMVQQQQQGYIENGGYYSSSSGYGTLQRPNSLEINHYAIENGHYGTVGGPHYAQQVGPHQPPVYTGYNTVSRGSHITNSHPQMPQYHQGQMAGGLSQQQQPTHPAYMGNQHPGQATVQRQPSLTSPQQQQLANNSHAMAQQQAVYGHYQQQNELTNSQQQSQAGNQSLGTPTRQRGSLPNASRPSQPPPAPPSNPSSSSNSGQGTPNAAGTPTRSRGPSLTRDVLPAAPPPPPPPPPMPGMMMNGNSHDAPDGELPPPPLPQTNKSNHIPGGAQSGGPPPPPPLPSMNNGPDAGDINSKSSFAQQIAQGHKQLQPPKMTTMNKLLPHVGQQHVDARSGLLAAIREGIKLRRVEDTKQKEVDGKRLCNDVASILARRVAMELSDSDSAHSDGSGGESDGWDDESNC